MVLVRLREAGARTEGEEGQRREKFTAVNTFSPVFHFTFGKLNRDYFRGVKFRTTVSADVGGRRGETSEQEDGLGIPSTGSPK